MARLVAELGGAPRGLGRHLYRRELVRALAETEQYLGPQEAPAADPQGEELEEGAGAAKTIRQLTSYRNDRALMQKAEGCAAFVTVS